MQNGDIEKVQKQRQKWGGDLEFLMSCISVSVGLGNVWRFPFVAYENGGGAFLIPYIIVLFLIGKPMYYLEVSLGQFTSQSSVRIWSICPSFVGVGIGQAYAGIAVLTYYSSLLAVILYYFVISFHEILPWTYCREEWGPICFDSESTNNLTNFNSSRQASSELYFLNTVIKETKDISNGIGTPSMQLAVALFISWLITFLVIVKGVKTAGKAVYFLAIFPYIILLILLVRSVTLTGAIDGIIFFLKPNWSQLLNLKVWKAAVVQCFFSLAVGLGPLVMFSSYNKFEHNVFRDALIVTSLDTVTSIIAGITIFGILGNLAHNLNISNIKEVIQSGTGLAFISYPNAIAELKTVPQLFAVLFFFMLFVLGIGTLVAQANSLVAILCDQYKNLKVWTVALSTCVFGFFSGLIYITPAGQWLITLVDYYGSTYVIFALAVFEIIGVSWVYGLQNFCDDMEFMTKRRINFFWRICWSVVTPFLLIFIFISSMVEMRTLQYAGLDYPESATIAGWILLAIGLVQFPIWMLLYFANIIHTKKTGLLQGLRTALKPSSQYGPQNATIREEWLLYKKTKSDQRRAELLKGQFFLQKIKHIFSSSADYKA